MRENIAYLLAGEQGWVEAEVQIRQSIAIAQEIGHPNLERYQNALVEILTKMVVAYLERQGIADPQAHLATLTGEQVQALVDEARAAGEK